MDILSKIESILFVAAKPLSSKEIAKAIGATEGSVADAVETLKLKYNREDSGIHMFEIDGDVKMGTNPANAEAVDGFIKNEAAGELTKAQLETLTVIAYRGPITRPELEQIRGVNCSLIIRNLLIRGLIEEREDEGKLMPVFVLSFDALRHLGITSPVELSEYETLRVHEHIAQVLEQKDASEEA